MPARLSNGANNISVLNQLNPIYESGGASAVSASSSTYCRHVWKFVPAAEVVVKEC